MACSHARNCPAATPNWTIGTDSSGQAGRVDGRLWSATTGTSGGTAAADESYVGSVPKLDPNERALADVLTKLTRRELAVEHFGPRAAGYGLGRLEEYPAPGVTTLVTLGASRQPFSMWRGLPLGNEAVLSIAGDSSEMADLLKAAVLEGHRRSLAKDRRRVMEANSVWAPGYEPHLLFTDAASVSPALMVQKKVGDHYVEFLSAIPIGDRELREYDRDVGAFIARLADSPSLATYPRSWP